MAKRNHMFRFSVPYEPLNSLLIEGSLGRMAPSLEVSGWVARTYGRRVEETEKRVFGFFSKIKRTIKVLW